MADLVKSSSSTCEPMAQDPEINPVAEEIGNRMDELSRRHEAAEKLREAPVEPEFAPPAAPLESRSGYKYAIINKAHRLLRPPSDRPAIRILGFFRDRSEVDQWVAEMRDNPGAVDREGNCKLGDMHVVPLFQYALVAKNLERERNITYISAKIEELKKTHLEHMEYAKKEFDSERAKKSQEATGDKPTVGRSGLSLERRCKLADEKQKKNTRTHALEHKKATRPAGAEVARVPRSLELRGQDFAIILVLSDVSPSRLSGKDDPEPAVMILDCFDSCAAAEEYIENQLRNYVFCFPMYVVDMYQWVFPEDVDPDEMREKFRNDEQDRIMQDKKIQKRKLLEYERKITEDVEGAPDRGPAAAIMPPPEKQ